MSTIDEKLRNLYDELTVILREAPEHDDWTAEEEDMYKTMTNLRETIANAGYCD